MHHKLNIILKHYYLNNIYLLIKLIKMLIKIYKLIKQYNYKKYLILNHPIIKLLYFNKLPKNNLNKIIILKKYINLNSYKFKNNYYKD